MSRHLTEYGIRLWFYLLLAMGMALTPAYVRAETPKPLIVFAAASLTDSLQRVSQAFTAETGIPVRHSFAASSTLARQIAQGARADILVSADQAWMDYLEQRSLIAPRTRLSLLGNRLALIAPSSGTAAAASPPLVIRTPDTLRALLPPLNDPRNRLIVADPQGVPLGRYSRAALESLDAWSTLRSRLAIADNARSALALVARGESPLGIVYRTDAIAEDRVRIIGLFDKTLHPVVDYPAAAVQSANAQAQKYLAFLQSEKALKIFREAGFEIETEPAHTIP